MLFPIFCRLCMRIICQVVFVLAIFTIFCKILYGHLNIYHVSTIDTYHTFMSFSNINISIHNYSNTFIHTICVYVYWFILQMCTQCLHLNLARQVYTYSLTKLSIWQNNCICFIDYKYYSYYSIPDFTDIFLGFF